MQKKRESLFFYSAAIILVLTALAKFYSVTGDAKVLAVSDQLLHVGYRPLMAGAAVVESLIAAYLIISKQGLARSGVLLWLSANFMAYHFGNHLLGLKVCPCLGRLSAKLPLGPGMAENLLLGCILYWFLGSFYILWRAWAANQAAETEALHARRFESGTP
jgi:hypothetical protein